MLQSTIILALLEQLKGEGDLDKRIALVQAAERQYYLDMEHQSNFVQTRIGALELDIREQVSTSLGATNEMISQGAQDLRDFRAWLQENLTANTAAVEGLRSETQAGFRDTYEQIGAIGERVSSNEARLAEHDQAIQSFRQSRDESQRERKEIRDDVAALAGRLDAFMGRIEALIANAATTPEQTNAYLDYLDLLRARDGLPPIRRIESGDASG